MVIERRRIKRSGLGMQGQGSLEPIAHNVATCRKSTVGILGCEHVCAVIDCYINVCPMLKITVLD